MVSGKCTNYLPDDHVNSGIRNLKSDEDIFAECSLFSHELPDCLRRFFFLLSQDPNTIFDRRSLQIDSVIRYRPDASAQRVGIQPLQPDAPHSIAEQAQPTNLWQMRYHR